MSKTPPVRPEWCEDEHLEYLDALRASGKTNMFGATAFLVQKFHIRNGEARAILLYWMKTFGEEER